MITRKEDWQLPLMQFLAAAARRPFQPGVHDCALFTAGAVEAMTGVDIAAAFRGRYSTLRGGHRVLRRCGYADHVAIAAYNFPEIAPAFAAPGDIAVVPTPDGPALGIVQGASIYVVAPTGLGAHGLLTASRAFKVG